MFWNANNEIAGSETVEELAAFAKEHVYDPTLLLSCGICDTAIGNSLLENCGLLS